MSRAVTPTLLSLDRWAKILGINPVHFSGAVGSPIWPDNGACEDIWPQYSWQTSEELVGREDVAMVIATAEEDIKNEMNYSPGATWEVDEAHGWSSLRSSYALQTNYGKVIAPGRRAVTLIDDAAAVVYSDPDNDTWDELATATVTTDLTDPREIKVYTAGHNGEPEWEIRPLRSVTFSGGVATIKIDAWLLIDPDLWEAFPTTSGFAGIDAMDSANFVTTVDVYREYNDTSQAGVTFYQMASGTSYCGLCSGVGCDVCSNESYGGCFSVIDARLGVVNPFPATYGDGSWTLYRPYNCRPVQRVTLSYYAGEVDKLYAQRRTLDPLSHYLAEAIMWLSVARLPKGVCSCNNIRDKVKMLQRPANILREGSEGSTLFSNFDKMDMFNCPFGIQTGAVMAWQRVARLADVIGAGGAL